MDALTPEAVKEIGRRVRGGGTHEHEIQHGFMESFQRENMVTDDAPIVAVNANSGNPHYEPSSSRPVPIREGDLVLLDVWAKTNTAGAVFYDITWVGFVGKAPSDRQREVFKIVSDARDIGVKTVQDAISSAKPIAGWEVDQTVRAHIKKAKHGDYVIHRTRHSIATEMHSHGA